MDRARNRIGIGILGLALVVLSLGCDLPLFTASETVSEVFETGDAPRIVVETFNGSIDISNGDDDEVVVEVTRRASGFDQRTADENLENIDVSFAQDGNEIRIGAQRVGHTFGNSGAAVVIAVPKAATIELKTSNAYIVAEGLRGGIDATTSNGKIEVYEATGPIQVATNNGSIRIEATDAELDAETSNGRVRFIGTLAEKENKIRTSNGRIDVILPPDSQFRYDAVTSNGHIDCEFAQDGDRPRSRRKRSGTVGDNPQCSLELVTSNGSIDIRKDD
jgi:Toastrack DUF4097